MTLPAPTLDMDDTTISAKPIHDREFARSKPIFLGAARRAGIRAIGIYSNPAPAQLANPHVIAKARDYHKFIQSNFLETLHVATS